MAMKTPKEISEYYTKAIHGRLPNVNIQYSLFPEWQVDLPCTITISNNNDPSKKLEYILKAGLNHIPDEVEINNIIRLYLANQ
jgi:hypothetical protein